MQLSQMEKDMLDTALDTEISRVKRAINAEKNQSIKEILSAQMRDYEMLRGRISKEPAK